jgi:hypothetical protein
MRGFAKKPFWLNHAVSSVPGMPGLVTACRPRCNPAAAVGAAHLARDSLARLTIGGMAAIITAFVIVVVLPNPTGGWLGRSSRGLWSLDSGVAGEPRGVECARLVGGDLGGPTLPPLARRARRFTAELTTPGQLSECIPARWPERPR